MLTDVLNSSSVQIFWNISHEMSAMETQKQPLEVFYKNVCQNLQENTCARVSFIIRLKASSFQLYLKKGLWTRCFPLNFTKFLKVTWGQNFIPVFMAYFYYFYRERASKKVLVRFHSYKVKKFWTQCKWRHTNECAKHFTSDFLCSFLLVFWRKIHQ